MFLVFLLAVNLTKVGTFNWNKHLPAVLCPILRPNDGTQEFLLAQPVAAFLPDITELLQRRSNLLPRGDSQTTQVMAADRETRDGPAAQFSQELPLTLVLQEFEHFALGVWLTWLQMQWIYHQIPNNRVTLRNTATFSEGSTFCQNWGEKNKLKTELRIKLKILELWDSKATLCAISLLYIVV